MFENSSVNTAATLYSPIPNLDRFTKVCDTIYELKKVKII
jgi:hypothetical protein